MTTPGVGQVATRKVRLFTPQAPLALASGATLSEVEVAYETYGELNERADNAVFICHALTGDAHAAGHHAGAKRPGWWDNFIGPGRAIDTDRWFVICANMLGGCQGTTGPSSPMPGQDRAYGLDFPLLQMADFVTVHRALMRHLGIERLAACVGGSLGGMQVQQWALTHPQEVERAIVIASSSRLTAQNIAFSAVARQAIMRDRQFCDGQYAAAGTAPQTGLAAARMMAHITYLSEAAMDEKFGRRLQDATQPRFDLGVDFQVESYLNHQGEAFLGRFDALSYLYLTRAMDYFDPFADADLVAVREAGTRFLVISFDSDWRFDTEQSRRIVRTLEGAGVGVSFREISSPWGHDSFLLDIAPYHATVSAWLGEEHR